MVHSHRSFNLYHMISNTTRLVQVSFLCSGTVSLQKCVYCKVKRKCELLYSFLQSLLSLQTSHKFSWSKIVNVRVPTWVILNCASYLLIWLFGWTFKKITDFETYLKCLCIPWYFYKSNCYVFDVFHLRLMLKASWWMFCRVSDNHSVI